MMVSTHRDKARVGTITSRMEHYLEWKDPYPSTVEKVNSPEGSQDVLIVHTHADTRLTETSSSNSISHPAPVIFLLPTLTAKQ